MSIKTDGLNKANKELIRRIFFIFFLFVIAMTNPAQASSTASDKSELLIIGDSLSAAYGIGIEEGWVSLLDKRLQEKYDGWFVRNASISGSTTGNGKQMLAKALQQSKPDLVIIALGGNDGLRGFPISLIEKNLRSLIQNSKQAGATVQLVSIELPTNYGKKYTEAFRGIYAKLAEEEDVQLLPFLLGAVFDDPDLMQEDGIHPNAEAQPIILDTVWKKIEQAIDPSI